MATETAAKLRKWCEDRAMSHLPTSRPLAIERVEDANELREAMCVALEAALVTECDFTLLVELRKEDK